MNEDLDEDGWLELLREVSPDGANSSRWKAKSELEKDLGVDSLSLMELVVSMEDAVGSEAGASDIHGLRTVGDVQGLWSRLGTKQ